MIKTGFIGTGNMGGALARAAAKYEGNEVLLFNRTESKARVIAYETGANVVEEEEIIKEADYIFLGIKPFLAKEMLPRYAYDLKMRQTKPVIVSMLAGTEIALIQECLGGFYPVIRIMPNIPAAVGVGMIMYDLSPEVTADQETEFLNIMKAAGQVIRLEERYIDAGSAVAGCGPAYVALFIEALADGGVACGLPRDMALKLAKQMVAGTAHYMIETDISASEMKDSVCSPGGTTIQGVRTLEQYGFRAAAMEAVIAAYEKTIR